MTNEQLEIAQTVLQSVFGEKAPTARLDASGGGEPVLVVDAFTIMDIEIEVPSIKGPVKVPAFSLDVAVDGDVTDLKTDRSFYAIVLELVQHIARMLADQVMENLMIDAWVKEWEADEVLAKEWRRS